MNKSGTTRLLQVLADTRASDENLAALQLHQALTGRGWAVRTLALAPGRHSELAAIIPVMAPSRRSFTAVGQFRTEQAWADVVLVRGLAVAGVARAAGRVPRRVLALWCEPARWIGTGRISRLDLFLLRSAASVVVSSESELIALEQLAPDLGDVRTISATGPAVGSVGSAVGDSDGCSGGEEERFAPEADVERWMECLDAALPSQP